VNKLEDLLKSAKPSVPPLPTDFSERVMTEIATLVVESGRSGINIFNFITACFLLLVGLLSVNSILFEVQMNGSLELLSFGTRFLADVFGYIPFDLIIPAVLIVALASRMMWASKAFKKGIAAVIVSSYLVTGVGGAALAATGMNEKILDTLIKDKIDWPVISWFYRERARFFINHPNFSMGRVDKLDNGFAWIVTPTGREVKVELPEGRVVKKGQVIRLAGSDDNGIFKGHDMNFCHPAKAQRYYHHMPMMQHHMNMQMNIKEHRQMMKQMTTTQ